MKNCFREKSVSDDEKRFFDQIERRGFAPEGNRIEGAWNIRHFSTEIVYTVPEIEDRFRKNRRPIKRDLVLWTRPNFVRMGVNVSLTSNGQYEDRETYHFFTEGPVSRTRALRYIDGYLEATVKGIAYEPSR